MPESRAPSDGKFGGVGEVGAGRGAAGVAALSQRMRQGVFGLGQALAAAGSQSEFSTQILHTRGTALDGGPDVSLGNGLAYANDHVRIVNANANDCQYRHPRRRRPAASGSPKSLILLVLYQP
jgi:hypothetical protein